MIRSATAERFDRSSTSGRNTPLRIGVRTEDWQLHDAFMKVPGRGDFTTEGMLNELLAAMLAMDLGLPMPEAFVVFCSQEWIDSIPHLVTRAQVLGAPRLLFALEAAGNQWALWNAGESLTLDRRDGALFITAFDAFIENADRRPSNPNLFVKGAEFRIFDHEAAFNIRFAMFPRPTPWINGNLERLIHAENGHALALKLKGMAGLPFDNLRMKWSSITDARVAEYRAAVPPEWLGIGQAIDDALAHIVTVRDRIDDCVAELRRVLT